MRSYTGKQNMTVADGSQVPIEEQACTVRTAGIVAPQASMAIRMTVAWLPLGWCGNDRVEGTPAEAEHRRHQSVK